MPAVSISSTAAQSSSSRVPAPSSTTPDAAAPSSTSSSPKQSPTDDSSDATSTQPEPAPRTTTADPPRTTIMTTSISPPSLAIAVASPSSSVLPSSGFVIAITSTTSTAVGLAVMPSATIAPTTEAALNATPAESRNGIIAIVVIVVVVLLALTPCVRYSPIWFYMSFGRLGRRPSKQSRAERSKVMSFAAEKGVVHGVQPPASIYTTDGATTAVQLSPSTQDIRWTPRSQQRHWESTHGHSPAAPESPTLGGIRVSVYPATPHLGLSDMGELPMHRALSPIEPGLAYDRDSTDYSQHYVGHV